MQLFTREMMDYIDKRFQAYYNKKSNGISISEAKMLIDYVSGPVPAPHGLRSSDMSRPRVSGGGKTRPTKFQIDTLLEKAGARSELNSAWDSIFEELIARCKTEPDAEKIIELTFKDRLYDIDICERMSISRTTYYEYRAIILSRAGILAIQKGLLKF